MSGKFIFDSDNPERDWAEDFHHENGSYMNHCVKCKEIFIGYKRRVVCKLCSDIIEPAPEAGKEN